MTVTPVAEGDRRHAGQSEWALWAWLSQHNALSVAFLQRLLTESLQVLTNVGGATGNKCDSATMAWRIPPPTATIPSLFALPHFFFVWHRRRMAAFRHEECQTIPELNNIQRWAESAEGLAAERVERDGNLSYGALSILTVETLKSSWILLTAV